jgi:hypothetical protein
MAMVTTCEPSNARSAITRKVRSSNSGRLRSAATPGHQLCLRQSTRATTAHATDDGDRPACVSGQTEARHMFREGATRFPKGMRRPSQLSFTEDIREPGKVRRSTRSQRVWTRSSNLSVDRSDRWRRAIYVPLRQRDGQAAKGDRPKAQNHDLFEKGVTAQVDRIGHVGD